MEHLSIRIDNKLLSKAHINDIALKLIRVKALPYKVREFANAKILKAIYHALFQSYILYACLTKWQNGHENNMPKFSH